MRLVSNVNPFRIKAPASVGVSTSYPTSDQVRPWLVHSQELGAELVLQTPPFWLIVAAALPSFTQEKRFLHVKEWHRWNLSTAQSANREFFSTYSTSQQESQFYTNMLLDNKQYSHGGILQVWTEHKSRFRLQKENLQGNVKVLRS